MAGRHQRHTSRDVLLSVGGGAVAGAQPLGRCFCDKTLGDGPVYHMLHHAKNVGNMSIEPFDKMFGTLIDSSKIAAWVMPAKGG